MAEITAQIANVVTVPFGRKLVSAVKPCDRSFQSSAGHPVDEDRPAAGK
jgi:hypothetical protein